MLYTGGTFDLFHFGHVRFLRQCAEIAELVIVSLNTDEFVASYKGKEPVMRYDERKKAIQSCRYVAAVVKNTGGEDSKTAIEVADPDVIAIGTDWQDRDYYEQMGFSQQWLDDRDIELRYLPYTEQISSTVLRQRLTESLSGGD